MSTTITEAPTASLDLRDELSPSTGEIRAVVAADLDARLRIAFYSKPSGCVQCTASKRKLDGMDVYKQTTKEFTGTVGFEELDVTQNPDAAAALRERGISQAPVFLVFFDGVEVDAFHGYNPDKIDLWFRPARAEDRSNAVAEFLAGQQA